MRALFKRPWIGPLVALVLVYALFCVLAPDTFGRVENLVTMARQTVVVSLAAVGMTFVIVHGGIDLAVGSQVALTAVVIAYQLKAGHGIPVALASGAAAAGLVGVLTGLFVARLGVAPFIVTLATMTILRGGAKGLADEQKIDVDIGALEGLMAGRGGGLAGIPPGVWITLAVAAAAAVVLHRSAFGLHVYAVGSNEATARLCGVDVARVKVLVYTLGALLAALAGVMELSRLTVGDPTDSIGLELSVIASVVIGGASLSGGEGTIVGSLVGAFLMTVIGTGCTHLGLPNWMQEIITGGIIVVAATSDRLRKRAS